MTKGVRYLEQGECHMRTLEALPRGWRLSADASMGKRSRLRRIGTRRKTIVRSNASRSRVKAAAWNLPAPEVAQDTPTTDEPSMRPVAADIGLDAYTER